MLQWDSDDESVGEMTRVSDALGDGAASYDRDDEEIDEMELLQLRNLVQQIKLQTVIGDNFTKFQNKESNTISLHSLVTPQTEEDVEVKYRQLMADHSDVAEERDQLAARLNQIVMQGGEDNHQRITKDQVAMQGGEDKHQRITKDKLAMQDGEDIHQRITNIERERDEARKETEAVKLEAENLKSSQRNLKHFYKEKVHELGSGLKKTSINNDGSKVLLEDYNRLKELHSALSRQMDESEKVGCQQQEDLNEAVKRAKYYEQELKTLKYSQLQAQNGLHKENSGLPGERMGGGGSLECEMMIPGHKVGLVIGKGGEIIKRLMEETGTKMFVNQGDPGADKVKAKAYEYPLRIVGKEENIEHAKARVIQILEAKQFSQEPTLGLGQKKKCDRFSSIKKHT